jgi:hypothetical protein
MHNGRWLVGDTPVQREEPYGASNCVAELLTMLFEVVVPTRINKSKENGIEEKRTTNLSAMTTSLFSSSFATFLMNTGAAFFSLTSSLCVCPNPKIRASATATAVFPENALVFY